MVKLQFVVEEIEIGWRGAMKRSWDRWFLVPYIYDILQVVCSMND